MKNRNKKTGDIGNEDTDVCFFRGLLKICAKVRKNKSAIKMLRFVFAEKGFIGYKIINVRLKTETKTGFLISNVDAWLVQAGYFLNVDV